MYNIGLKEVFNIKNTYNGLGYEGLTEEAQKKAFKVYSTESSFIYDILSKDHKIIRSTCTPFCVGNLDTRFSTRSSLYLGASSSGCALDVLEDKIDIGVGTDTGNSTIWPAARHNLFAFKPTYGSISRQGLVPLCSILDTVSLISKDPKIIKQIYLKLLKKDPHDLTQDLREKSLNNQVVEHKIYLAKNLFSRCELLDIKQKYPNVIQQDLILPDNITDILSGAYLYIMAPEFFSNMNRFNSFFQKKNFWKNIIKKYTDAEIAELRTNLFSKEIKKRIMIGAHLLSPSERPYDIRNLHKLQKYLDSVLGPKIWILPVVYNSTMNQNQYASGTGPIWPLIANITKRPSVVIPDLTKVSTNYYFLGLKNNSTVDLFFKEFKNF